MENVNTVIDGMFGDSFVSTLEMERGRLRNKDNGCPWSKPMNSDEEIEFYEEYNEKSSPMYFNENW